VDEVRIDLQRICQRHNVVTVAVTDMGDSHPDHRAAHHIAIGLEGVEVLSYPVSARFDGDDYSPPGDILHLAAWPGDAKRSALLCHRSQMEAAAVCPMTMTTIDRFCADPEYFIPVGRRAS
jgi:LmbE family N-acetylglucosaminyl deacetylase